MKKLSVSLTRSERILGWIYLFLYLLIIPVVLDLVNLFMGSPLNQAQINFIFFLINFISVWAIAWRFLVNNGKTAFSNIPKVLTGLIAGFFLYWVLNFVLSIIIFRIDPGFSNANDEYINQMSQQNSQLIAVGAVFLVPLTEEFLFRGLIFQSIYNRSRILAYLVSAVTFAALHVVGYITQYDPVRLLLCFLQYIPACISLAWSYAYSNSIWTPVLIHMAVNQIAISAMG